MKTFHSDFIVEIIVMCDGNRAQVLRHENHRHTIIVQLLNFCWTTFLWFTATFSVGKHRFSHLLCSSHIFHWFPKVLGDFILFHFQHRSKLVDWNLTYGTSYSKWQWNYSRALLGQVCNFFYNEFLVQAHSLANTYWHWLFRERLVFDQ